MHTLLCMLITRMLGIIAALYLLGAGYAYVTQDAQIFPREQFEPYPITLDSSMTDVHLPTSDGATLHGLIVNVSPTVPKQVLVVVYPGNQHDGRRFAGFIGRDVLQSDAVVVGFQHRGYGQSTGTPSMDNLYADAVHIYDTYVSKFKPSHVYVLGYSLGSSIAAYVASQREASGLMLITPFTSMVDMAKAEYPYYPVGMLLKHHFPTQDILQDVQVPTAIVVAGKEELIPTSHAPRLADTVGSNLLFSRTLPHATHGDVLDQPEFPDVVKEFIKQAH